MFKTGIYRRKQLQDIVCLKEAVDNGKKISITLYHEAMGTHNETAEIILSTFMDERGAFKRTYSNRFEEFDNQAIEIIQQRLKNKSLVVHDTAISDGRTACDFFKKIRDHYSHLDYYASDYSSRIYVIKSFPLSLVVNNECTVLEMIFPPFVFNRNKESLRYHPINYFLRLIIQGTLAKYILHKYKNGTLQSQEYLLFCPEALDLEHQDGRFHLMQYNLLDRSPFSEPIDILKAMNILNLSYFTIEEFQVIINNIFHALKEGGLFITGTNQESNTPIHGGVFQRSKDRFIQLLRSGTGSPIENVILNYRVS